MSGSTAVAQWSEIAFLPDQVDYEMAYDRSGKAVYLSNGDVLVFNTVLGEVTSPPGVFPPTGEPAYVEMRRTSDNGATWSAPTVLRTGPALRTQAIGPTQATVLPSGRIVISFFYTESSFPDPFVAYDEVWYSDDNGTTWTQAASFPPNLDGGAVVLTSTPGGTLIQTWDRSVGNDGDIAISKSEDGGVTWSEPVQVVEIPNWNVCGQTLSASSDTDFLVIYSDCVFGLGGTSTVRQTRSTDGGATWSAPTVMLTRDSAFGFGSSVHTAGGTTWLLYNSGDDLYYVTSQDRGMTWSAPERWTYGNRNIGATLSVLNDAPFAVFMNCPTNSQGCTSTFKLRYGVVGQSVDPLFVSVEEVGGDVPSSFSLSQNYPNPFNPSTTISFSLPHSANVLLTAYDILGRVVDEVVSGTYTAGNYEVSFDANELPAGTYVYRLKAGEFSETRSMVLLK
jgi:hypothetical protein